VSLGKPRFTFNADTAWLFFLFFFQSDGRTLRLAIDFFDKCASEDLKVNSFLLVEL
jgi:hypothetical protein